MTQLHFDAATLSTRDAYRLMTSIITPRPIAWVSTVGADEAVNLAPYSYFQGVSSSPPTVVLGVGSRPDGREKDTLRNALATGELCISHVSDDDAERMNASSAGFEPGVSEASALDIEMAASRFVQAPRVASARAALECRLTHAIPLGERPDGSPSSTLVIARVVGIYVAEALLRHDAKGRPLGLDPDQLASVGRLGGLSYARTRDRFELDRPATPAQAKPGSGPDSAT